MRRVQAAENDLRELGALWQLIESSASISCPDEVATILPTLVDTRERFNRLRQQLVSQMAAENVAELGDDLTAKAQCAIDILVRNLYERTADVGFLATDDSVVRFCRGDADAPSPAEMVARLTEYQTKYTVYDDVMLLSPQGQMLARLASAEGMAPSLDPIVAAALAAPGYVEQYASTDLSAGGAPALLYAHGVRGPGAQILGVLVLRFRFADEMQHIFDGADAGRSGLSLTLVDSQRRVIASNDSSHVPLGAVLPLLEQGPIAPVCFAGREYLAVCRASAGYQGYAGPAWRAVAMVSLLTAFPTRLDRKAPQETVPLDNAELAAINADAGKINRDLRLVVWNGRLMAGTPSADHNRLKAVLTQVGAAGRRTRERVESAVRDIYATSMERAVSLARDRAGLAADILDRNLYERANDCRWWALTPVFRQVLAQPVDAEGANAMTAVLDHINGLYTVYSRLVVFDAHGTVHAISRTAGAEGLLGQAVPQAWSQAVQGLSGSQGYTVSAFGPTVLHDGGDTWVYLAAIRAERDTSGAGAHDGRPVGGIAIVFHAAAELAAMLRDVLGSRAGFAAFVDRDGRVIAATDDAAAAATAAVLAADPSVLSRHDVAVDRVVAHGGANHACALARGQGYREFRRQDRYDHGMRALVGLRLGPAEGATTGVADMHLAVASPAHRTDHRLEASLFQVGPDRYALPSNQVMRAVSPRGLLRLPNAGGATQGLLEVHTGGAVHVVPVLCGRRLFNVPGDSTSDDGIVVLLHAPHRPGLPVLGLRVDDILVTLEFTPDQISAAPPALRAFAPWVDSILNCTSGDGAADVLVPLLDSQRLAQDHEAGAAAALSAPAQTQTQAQTQQRPPGAHPQAATLAPTNQPAHA